MPLVCGLLVLVRLWSMSSTGQIELVIVALGAAKLGAAIGQHARQADAVLVVKRHHPIIEDLGRGDRGLAIVEFGKGDWRRCR
jgi:hypothetical protein